MSLRQKVLTNEEDCLYDANFSKIRFLHALEFGIRNGNVRNDLYPLLKNPTITDEELLECVTFGVSNESEWAEKFSNKKKSDTSVFFIDKQQEKDNFSIYKLRSSNWTIVSNFKPFVLRWKYCKKAKYRPTETHIYALFVQADLKLRWIIPHPGSLFSKINNRSQHILWIR